jgi:serine/threonine protein kinase
MSVDHPNIVKLYECFEDTNEYHLVMEYLEGGDLFDYIRSKGGVVSERETAQIGFQIL